MRKTLTILGLAWASAVGAQAQTIWNYSFGTGTGTYNTASGNSTTFLPTPPTNGGTAARVRVGSGGGSFNLVNPGTGIGTGSELNIVAPSSGSLNKFSIYDYTTASTTFSIAFELRLSGGSSGTFYFFMGDGTNYSDNLGFGGSQVFTGLQFVYGASNTITTNNRAGGSWSTISGTPFAQNVNYSVEIYGNNSASSQNYTRGTSQTVASNTYDLWINGTLVGNDLGKALIPNAANIDSFMFYGENSTGNVANLNVDSIVYANGLTAVPEPSTWALIGLGTTVVLMGIRRRRSIKA